MKIFSLETKKHLVGWSLVLGVLFNFLTTLSLLNSEPTQTYYECVEVRKGSLAHWISPCPYYSAGWPITLDIYDKKNYGDPFKQYYTFFGIINISIWAIFAHIILSLIRHFKNKMSVVSTK